MTTLEHENLATVRRYLESIQTGVGGEAMRQFFDETVEQIELPNRLNPAGLVSDLASMMERSEQGRKLLSSQSYDIVSDIAQGDRVAVEARWTGTLAVPFGNLPIGHQMKAHFAIFLELKDGKIILQRNYDCFEAW
jgi:ketosteroid isomerase-like protein